MALTLAQAGHEVIAVDCDVSKINQLNEGHTSIFEPGLSDLLKKTLRQKKMRFTNNLKLASENSEVFMMTVGTPAQQDSSADLSCLFKALTDLRHEPSSHQKLVILKSTIPPGTTAFLKTEFPEFHFIFNPEFIREGSALSDAEQPDRIVIGSENKDLISQIKILYKDFVKSDSQFLVMDSNSAELCKYAANAFLAARVSLINEFSQIADLCGANIEHISTAIGLDPRIGPAFLKSGIGFGGSCFPKDISAIQAKAQSFSLKTPLLEAIQQANQNQVDYFANKVLRYFKQHPRIEKRISIWGISFKPQTNDLRESPALKILNLFLDHQFKIQLHDPESLDSLSQILTKEQAHVLNLNSDPLQALEKSNALVILTEWPIYSQITLQKIKTHLASAVIFDGRNIFNPQEAQNLNFHYESVGRPL